MAVVDAVIQILTEQVLTALLSRAHIIFDFKNQLVTMRTQLELMNAFLNDAGKSNKETEKVTMIKMRELIYEADDVLTDCLIRDEYNQKLGSCSNFYPHNLIFQYQTGRKLREINLRIEKMENGLRTYLKSQQSNIRADTLQVTGFTTQDIDASDIVGLENDTAKIKRWILSTEKVLHKVGIVGIGGLGKSTIAQKIFSDEDVCARFKNMIWLSVTQDFNLERIMRSMLEQLYEAQKKESLEKPGEGCSAWNQRDEIGKNDYELEKEKREKMIEVSLMDKFQMMQKIRELVLSMSCLIIVDDVWRIDIEWWNILRFDLEKDTEKSRRSDLKKETSKSRCIIITSRDEKAVRQMGVDSSRIYHAKVLSEHESCSLFCKQAISSKGILQKDQLEELGKRIAETCGGVPLAIKTAAANLAQKADSFIEWEDIGENFHELVIRGHGSLVMASLRRSYDVLPRHLKQFLLCFSIFPKDFEIPAEQLVRWWVGEGPIQGKDSKTAMELGYEYLSELVEKCLVEVVEKRGSYRRIYKCRIHNLVRCMITSIAEDETFSCFERGNQKLTPDSRWLGLTSEICTGSLEQCPKLRAFILMSSYGITFNRNVGSLGSLRVLDFSYSRLDSISIENLLNWICSLKRLTYLNLSGAADLKEVPSSIQKLRNLQYLVLSGCRNLIKLHPSITYLKKLVVLDLGSCGLQYLPQGLEMLSQLQELSGFRLANQENTPSCHLVDIKQLVQLRVLRMSLSNESKISEEECDVLLNLKELKVLSIDTEECRDGRILEMLHQLYPPPRLQELYLRRYSHETLPKWFNPRDLYSLKYLCIENADLVHIPESIKTEEGKSFYWNLESLCLKIIPKLEEDWEKLRQNMPRLSCLEVCDCENLKNLPCSVSETGIWRESED